MKLTGRVIIIKFAGSPPQQAQQSSQQQQPRPQHPQNRQQAPQQSQQGAHGPDYESFDDDIPFAPLPYLSGA
ncbi:hypothetical protein [Pseudomonas sp.]|uniref:hypothetical protein n=1 Tax=Pseudomonas sp. TaxID=306 RepID=UPI003BAEE0BD